MFRIKKTDEVTEQFQEISFKIRDRLFCFATFFPNSFRGFAQSEHSFGKVNCDMCTASEDSYLLINEF